MFNKTLCIDDDPITLMLCEKVIIKAQFSKTVDKVLNGEQALAYFKNLKENNLNFPDIVFLDLNMPVMDGWEFLDLISGDECCRVLFKDIKIIILSSTVDPNDIKKAEKYTEVYSFLSKPITTGMLNQIK